MLSCKTLQVFLVATTAASLSNASRYIEVLYAWKRKNATFLKIEIVQETDECTSSLSPKSGEVHLFVWIGEDPPAAKERSRLRLLGMQHRIIVVLSDKYLNAFRTALPEFHDSTLSTDAFSVEHLEKQISQVILTPLNYDPQAPGISQFSLNEFETLLGSRFDSDLRTPLKLIADSVHSLSAHGGEHTFDRSLNLVRDATSMLLFRVMDLLDVSERRVKANELQDRSFGVRSLFKSIEMVLALKASFTKTELVMVVNETVPNQLVGDPERIGQVLLRLVENLLVYSPESGIMVMVETEPQEGSNINLKISASDSGANTVRSFMGDAISVEQICEFLEQQNRKISPELLNSFKLLVIMGGKLSVRGKPGQGAVVQIEIPLKSSLDLLVTDEPQNVNLEEESLTQSETILVVDDNAVNRKVLETMLIKKGYQVLLANNGAEAIALYERHSINIILMDIEMPIMDGINACKAIRKLDRKENRYTPIIMVTTRRMDDVWNECHEAGADGYVSKPVNFTQLQTMIKNVLSNLKTFQLEEMH